MLKEGRDKLWYVKIYKDCQLEEALNFTPLICCYHLHQQEMYQFQAKNYRVTKKGRVVEIVMTRELFPIFKKKNTKKDKST